MNIGLRRTSVTLALGLSLLATWMAGSICHAGGGSENVFLLVNSTSIDSITVANHYVSLRNLPPQNVYFIGWRASKAETSGELFRERLLQPALEQINRRGLGLQIDYLVYSCDFPWRVNFQNDFPGVEFPRQVRPTASLTGATYLWPFAIGKRKEMFSLRTNFYFSPHRNGLTLTRGFRSRYFWNEQGRTTKEKGVPYLLSTMLGVTFGRGNTVPEIVRYLTSAAKADATSPAGTIYYVQNGTPRSTPRHDDFPQAIADLKLMGVHAELAGGRFVQNKQQIMGVTTGAPRLNIAGSGCRFLPGALADNLTSAGGNLVVRKTKAPPQTPVSEFLRFGCAGACGTVIEPLNFPEKFPSAWLHVHYARGCSLAEAFYLSIAGPYQQLIVGDPLCQPWAKKSEVVLEEIEAGQRLSGKVEITPTVKNGTASLYELYLNGQRKQECKPGNTFSLDTTKLADGYHELRVVATDQTPLETRSRWLGQVLVKNGLDALQLSVDPASLRNPGNNLKVTVSSSAEGDVSIYHLGRKVGSVEDGNGQVLIPLDKLGKGPVVLSAVLQGEQRLRSRPLRLVIP